MSEDCRYCGGGDFMEDDGGNTICSYCKRVHDDGAHPGPATENEAAIWAFATQFAPELTVCRAERIDGVPYADAWVASYRDDEKSIGVSGFAFDGHFKAYIEAAGALSIAESAGRVMAKATGMDVK
jgi:hypothetical protein